MHRAFRDGFEKTAWLWANPKTFKDHLGVLQHYGFDHNPESYVKALRDNLRLGRMGAEAQGKLDTHRAMLRKQIRSAPKREAS